MSATQLTLTGEQTDETREKPETFMWCDETEQWILRSLRADWPYDLYEHPEAVPSDSSSSSKPTDDDDEDEAERVGAVYEIELSYTVDFTFRVPAWSEHEAEDRAKDLVDYPNNCSMMDHVHTRDREVTELFEDSPEIPDDWDPYGSTPLWEVYGKDSTENKEDTE